MVLPTIDVGERSSPAADEAAALVDFDDDLPVGRASKRPRVGDGASSSQGASQAGGAGRVSASAGWGLAANWLQALSRGTSPLKAQRHASKILKMACKPGDTPVRRCDGAALAQLLLIACDIQARTEVDDESDIDDYDEEMVSGAIGENCMRVALPQLLAAYPLLPEPVGRLATGPGRAIADWTGGRVIGSSSLYESWASMADHLLSLGASEPDSQRPDACCPWTAIWHVIEAGLPEHPGIPPTDYKKAPPRGFLTAPLPEGALQEGSAQGTTTRERHDGASHRRRLGRLCVRLLWHPSPAGRRAGLAALGRILSYYQRDEAYAQAWLNCVQWKVQDREAFMEQCLAALGASSAEPLGGPWLLGLVVKTDAQPSRIEHIHVVICFDECLCVKVSTLYDTLSQPHTCSGLCCDTAVFRALRSGRFIFDGGLPA